MSLQLNPRAPIFIPSHYIGPKCQECGVSTINVVIHLQLIYDSDDEELSGKIEGKECWCNTLNRFKYCIWYEKWVKEVNNAANIICRFIYRHRFIQ